MGRRRDEMSYCLICGQFACAHLVPVPHLTPRELTMLRLVGEGWTNKAIAHEMGLAPGSVKVMLTHLYEKLPRPDNNVAPRGGAMLWWMTHPELHAVAQLPCAS